MKISLNASDLYNVGSLTTSPSESAERPFQVTFARYQLALSLPLRCIEEASLLELSISFYYLTKLGLSLLARFCAL